MSRYRRNRDGRTYFFTVVTHQRRRILTSERGLRALREAFRAVRMAHPFTVIAIAVLPDHLHTFWELPREDSDYSTRWRRIKGTFTRSWKELVGPNASISESRERRGERDVWQRRFFEHTCRDDDDLKRCLDYVHINPLKHGLVKRVSDWRWSSFHRYVKCGEYPQDWGNAGEWHGDEFQYFE